MDKPANAPEFVRELNATHDRLRRAADDLDLMRRWASNSPELMNLSSDFEMKIVIDRFWHSQTACRDAASFISAVVDEVVKTETSDTP